MLVAPALLLSQLVANQPAQEASLLAAVPADAYALVRVADPDALRSRTEGNDWVTFFASPGGEPAVLELGREYEAVTGTDFDGLLEVALELHGEALLFFTGEVAGFLTVPPPDRAALAEVLSAWLPEEPRQSSEIAGGTVQLATWPEAGGGSRSRAGEYLAFLDHPLAMGLYSGDSAEAVLAALGDSLGALGSERRAPVVEGFLAAGGGTTGGIEGFLDFTPFVAEAEKALREAVDGVLPDPTGLLGLEQGTWLFVTADAFPGTKVEVNARLRIPPGTLAAKLADTFEPLPRTLPSDLPSGTWTVWALDWNLSRFYATARAGLEEKQEDGFAMVDQGLAAAEALAGVDPIEDVIDQLSGLFALYHVLDGGEMPERYDTGFAFLVGLVNGDRFMEALEAVLDTGALDVDATELEGAEAYLAGPDLFGPDESVYDGGIALLPHRLLMSLSRDTLARGLRAIGRVEGAGLTDGSELQAAFDENAGACAFVYTELSKLRALEFLQGWQVPEENDPFESRLIFAARRTPDGFDVRLYTR